MKIIIAFLFVVIATTLLYLSSGLGFKFTEVVGSPEVRAIKYRLSDELAVKPAIIDYQIEGRYAFGFRLPAFEATCEDGKHTSLLLSLDGVYFVLDLDSESYAEFNQSEEFYRHILSLGLKKGLNYNSAELEKVVATYDSRYKEFDYFRTCKPL